MPNAFPDLHDRALEVIATMDDTVLSVRHLTQAGRKRTPTALFTAGALGLAIFAGAMFHTASVAAQNRAALSAWQATGNADLDFRPLRVTSAVDAAGILGLLAGLALITAGVWRTRRERQPDTYRIGRKAGVDEGCDAIDELTLISATRDGGWHVQPAPGMTGDVFTDGKKTAALRAGDLPANAKIFAQIGPLAFIISTVSAPRAAEGGAVQVEPRSLMSVGASAFAHVVLLALFFLLPASAEGYSNEDLDGAVRVSLVQAKPQEDPLKQPDPKGDAGGDPLKTAAPSPGVAGAKTANTEGKVKVKRTAEQPQTARPTAETARSAGILGVMNARRAAFTELTSTGDFSSGFDDDDVHGNFRGDQYADASGEYGGHGCLPGTPCGHSPVSTAGTGDYLTNGPRGTFPGTGTGPGTGDPLHGRKPHPTLDIGPAQVPDGVDKNVIRRYVRQKHDELSWCYQKQLTVQPTLSGTSTMAFTIDQNGRVIEAAAHGMDAPNVERCLETVVRSINFPAGNIIHVTAYPFIFHPVGQ